MGERCLLYYITDRKAFPGDEAARRTHLLEKIAEAARCGVDYIQLREKDLTARELESLAHEAIQILKRNSQLRTESGKLRTRLLVNSRTDVALATGAAGVHLRADDLSPLEVRAVWKCGVGTPARENPSAVPLIGISCHSTEEVARAAAQGADFAVFAPVFEKRDVPGSRPTGLDLLRHASSASIPVLALGGVTLSNAPSCLQAGAAGIAAIRLFQENDIASVVKNLRCS